jgi:hypothetical protein
MAVPTTPFPATVVASPVMETKRIAWFKLSATKTPSMPVAIPVGLLNAADVPKPSMKPGMLLPASVKTTDEPT